MDLDYHPVGRYLSNNVTQRSGHHWHRQALTVWRLIRQHLIATILSGKLIPQEPLDQASRGYKCLLILT